ncbi:type I methionyl aminopeptidase [Patescibacteria group bacterium]|nr:type I methionyl aminopeptidase [Patescibacteria group bacterium]MBU1673665.1 type I methionyl aminopeptidase [Patescibacteria group bacterium]MBU1963847.1 type I methionyl aminopeptidase [Patescibacteria group bacterium]
MITIKTKEEIEKLREGGQILAFVLDELKKMVAPGVEIMALDQKAEELIAQAGGVPSFKGYKGYPNAICASLNQEVVHCPPAPRTLKEGDILSLDCGVKYKEMFTDSAITVPVGKISPEVEKLIKVTKECLDRAINISKPGATIGDVGAIIQKHAEENGFSVVKSLVGHGVGHAVHEDPRIPNYSEAGTGEVMKEGMVFAYEPMVNVGGSQVDFLPDGWRVKTKDDSLSAHFEHTVLITKNGCNIITKLNS